MQDLVQDLFANVDPLAKVAEEDIVGLSLGAVVAVFAPVFSFIVLRRWFGIQARFALLGLAVAIGSHELLVFPLWLFSNAFEFAAETMVPANAHTAALFLYFKSAFAITAANSVFQITLPLVVLAVLSFADRSGRPALALGIGFSGWTCWLQALGLVQNLMFALRVNSAGVEAAFGTGVNVSSSTFANMFTLGLPRGSAAVAQFSLLIFVLLVAWSGLRPRRWRRIALAYGVAVAAAAGAALASAVADLWMPTGFVGAWSPVGVLESYYLALGIAVVTALYRYRRFFVGVICTEVPTNDEPRRRAEEEDGLFATWRKQSL